MIRIELSELAAERISTLAQVQIIIKSIIMISLSYCAHVIQFFYGFIVIPNKTIDLLTTSQKIKQIAKRKLNDNIQKSIDE